MEQRPSGTDSCTAGSETSLTSWNKKRNLRVQNVPLLDTVPTVMNAAQLCLLKTKDATFHSMFLSHKTYMSIKLRQCVLQGPLISFSFFKSLQGYLWKANIVNPLIKQLPPCTHVFQTVTISSS
jgi:hypothetical protein